MRCKHGLYVEQCAYCKSHSEAGIHCVTDDNQRMADSIQVTERLHMGYISIPQFVELFRDKVGVPGKMLNTFKLAFKHYYHVDFDRTCDYWWREVKPRLTEYSTGCKLPRNIGKCRDEKSRVDKDLEKILGQVFQIETVDALDKILS